MVNVRAKRVGPIGLVSTRMYTYSVNTRTGVAAQSLMTRISMGCGKELPAHTAAEQSLMSLTLPTQTLAKMPGAVGEKGTIDLVIRVKVWNNPFHVVFKDELYDLVTIIAGAVVRFGVHVASFNGSERGKRTTSSGAKDAFRSTRNIAQRCR